MSFICPHCGKSLALTLTPGDADSKKLKGFPGELITPSNTTAWLPPDGPIEAPLGPEGKGRLGCGGCKHIDKHFSDEPCTSCIKMETGVRYKWEPRK